MISLCLPLGRRPAPARWPPEPRDAIVVLGSRLTTRGEVPPPLRERCAAAAALFRGGGAPKLIVTGGLTGPAGASGRTEADAMAEALAPLPVVVEARARTTAENAREVAAILPSAARVWLVTQPFHAPRAAYLFARAGLRPRVWPLPDSLQFADERRAARWLVREYAAWLRAAAGALV